MCKKQKQKTNVNLIFRPAYFSHFILTPSNILPSRVVARGLGVSSPRVVITLGGGVRRRVARRVARRLGSRVRGRLRRGL
jgi:hypothetical protein